MYIFHNLLKKRTREKYNLFYGLGTINYLYDINTCIRCKTFKLRGCEVECTREMDGEVTRLYNFLLPSSLRKKESIT
jgi:Fe-S-cluster-containing dehydrogenase component